jgi:dipeptidyl aminopeptidase/acylaminoacyl peptidase
MSITPRRPHFVVLAVLVLVALLFGAWLATRPAAPALALCGAYRLADGRLLYVSPSEGKTLRFRLEDGRSARLYPRGAGLYDVGTGFSAPAPVTGVMSFGARGPDGRPTTLSWRDGNAPELQAAREPLREREAFFESGSLRLRGKLVLPAANGRFAAVVLVHGSNDDSAVDNSFEPYLWAAHGFAGVVFDKRGTGESQGHYLQNFQVLAADVVAALRWARTQPEVDGERVQLAGFSQGGWVAPLAAVADGHVRSVLVGYGPLVTVHDEDRWGYLDALSRKGYGPDAIAAADRIDAEISAIVDRGENRWSELGRLLDEAEGKPWLKSVRGSDSLLGFVVGKPLFLVRPYSWWSLRSRDGYAFIDRLYDPVPTLQKLEAPSLWLLGGKDSSMPTGATVEALGALAAAGRPVEWVVFPDAEHGIIRAEDGPQGRRLTGYEARYFPMMLEWLQKQAAVQEAPK